MKKNLFGISYVSFYIIIWGSIASLIDYPLLESDIYNAGSIGQYITFTLTGIIFTIIAIKLFPKIKDLRIFSYFSE